MASVAAPASKAELARARAVERLDEVALLLESGEAVNEATTLRAQEQLRTALQTAARLHGEQATRALQRLEQGIQQRQRKMEPLAGGEPDTPLQRLLRETERVRLHACDGQENLDRLRLRDSTLMVLLSDHGTNFAENPEKVTGKPADYMYPGTMDIPLIVRHPESRLAGRVRDELVYSLDVPATVLAATGVEPVGEVEGQSLLPLIEGTDGFAPREYLTCRYGNSLWYRDDRTWFFSQGDFSEPRVFDLEADPSETTNVIDRFPEIAVRLTEKLEAIRQEGRSR